MRLRLSIQRHALPPANVLWSVPDSSSPQAYTIARLLEDVNNIIPLEAAEWGFEDYAVEVGGFECLHFSPVAQALKDDDEVLIRPLLTAEVRARTLSGRYQISDSGQHLVDGVPFGRPYLRKPNRPAVRIPPRKRQRLLEDTAGGDEETQVVGLITANGETVRHEDDGSVTSEDEVRQDALGARQRKHSGKIVQFKEPVVEGSDDDDEEEDDDFAPDEEGEASDVSMQQDSSEDDSDDSSEASSSSSSDSDSSSGTESDSDSDSGESGGPEVVKFVRTTSHQAPPHMGLKTTKTRNRRRRASAQLRNMKKQGVLPKDAKLEHLRALQQGTWDQDAYEEMALAENGHDPSPASTSKKRKRGAELGTSEVTAEGLSELELRKQELMAKISENVQGVEEDEPLPVTPITGTVAPQASEEPSPAGSASRRLRPNVTAINRILSRQARPMSKQALPKSKATLPEEAIPTPPADSDFWRSKINLSAFECWEEEFELSAPPFPFKQHWDPASKLIRAKVNRSKQKRKSSNPPPREAKANSDESGDTIELDYGEAPATEQKSDADTAAIESQLLQDVEIATQADLPALPDDVESLPALARSDVKVGAIIAFKLFGLNPTNMNPEISGFKTAVVEEEGDSGNGTGVIGLKLAERDQTRKEKRFDKNGNRIYDRADNFQMEDEEDEDEDGLLRHQFDELIEAKLLKAA